jgi:3-mercaptopyruvate sulfurtransferase SseA
MHVHELNPKKTLIALLAFVILLLVGFFTMHKPLMTYQLDMKQSLEMLHQQDACFYPWQLTNVLNKKDKDVVLIDIRDKFTYGQGHIPGSENISAFDLTKEENISRLESFKDQGLTVVLYGKDQLQANAPWMLFRQVGFDNVKILLGGYDYYLAHQSDLMGTKTDKTFLKGLARYDFAKVAAKTGAMAGKTKVKTKKPVIIRRKKKAVVASGGC